MRVLATDTQRVEGLRGHQGTGPRDSTVGLAAQVSVNGGLALGVHGLTAVQIGTRERRRLAVHGPSASVDGLGTLDLCGGTSGILGDVLGPLVATVVHGTSSTGLELGSVFHVHVVIHLVVGLHARGVVVAVAVLAAAILVEDVLVDQATDSATAEGSEPVHPVVVPFVEHKGRAQGSSRVQVGHLK